MSEPSGACESFKGASAFWFDFRSDPARGVEAPGARECIQGATLFLLRCSAVNHPTFALSLKHLSIYIYLKEYMYVFFYVFSFYNGSENGFYTPRSAVGSRAICSSRRRQYRSRNAPTRRLKKRTAFRASEHASSGSFAHLDVFSNLPEYSA